MYIPWRPCTTPSQDPPPPTQHTTQQPPPFPIPTLSTTSISLLFSTFVFVDNDKILVFDVFDVFVEIILLSFVFIALCIVLFFFSVGVTIGLLHKKHLLHCCISRHFL